MRPAERLRNIEGAPDARVSAVKWLIVSMFTRPHLEADLDRLFEQLVALAQGRVRQTQSGCLFRIVTDADAEHRPAAREHVQSGHDLGEQPGRAIWRRGGEREQPDAIGASGDEAESRVRLD